MIELNAWSKLTELIKKFEKTSKINLKNDLKCDILWNRNFHECGDGKNQTSKKFEKKLIIRLDKHEKLWYIKQQSIATVIGSWLKIE